MMLGRFFFLSFKHRFLTALFGRKNEMLFFAFTFSVLILASHFFCNLISVIVRKEAVCLVVT